MCVCACVHVVYTHALCVILAHSIETIVSSVSPPPNLTSSHIAPPLHSPHHGLSGHSPKNLLVSQLSGKTSVETSSPLCPQKLESVITGVGIMVILEGVAGWEGLRAAFSTGNVLS